VARERRTDREEGASIDVEATSKSYKGCLLLIY